MPADVNSGSPRNKPTTRSSIRNTLGKAFADVINKEGRDSDKNAKKTKDSSSRRLSAINLRPSAPRASMDNSKLPSQSTKRVETPEAKVIARRRVSVTYQRPSSDERPPKSSSESLNPTPTSGMAKSSTLRLKPTTATSLPKYRPRSAIEAKPPSSPARAGTRRRFSNSDEEKEDKPVLRSTQPSPSPVQKGSRPISPLPQRAALKANLSSVVNTPTTPTKAKGPTPNATKVSPSRPAKIVKTSATAGQSAIPRPPSSTSSASSFTPHTPKTPSAVPKSGTSLRQSDKTSRASPSPFSPPDSPLARHSRNGSADTSKNATPSASAASSVGNMSHISEGASEDSDEDDVELLLAPVADPTAPTPAMPRIQVPRNRRRLPPQTPTRASGLPPTRANLSYLSPLPPDNESSPTARRTTPRSTERQARGSILSWEQLASEASKILGDNEIESMLAEMPAPFRSGAVSPTPSSTGTRDVPESPCLSGLSSPGGYGSISQVLLPDVTPSPAMHPVRYDLAADLPLVDAAIVTLLKLQLASAENTAKERLYQMQRMEEEIHNLKEARARDAQELTAQVSIMESEVRGTLEARERTDEERAGYTAALEDQLRHMQAFRDQAVEDAVKHAVENARVESEARVRRECQRRDAASSARITAAEWATVGGVAGGELESVRAEKGVLAVLLAELDSLQGMMNRVI